MSNRTCSVEGCEQQTVRRKPQCARHWPKCSADGCELPRYCKGFCVKHYERVKKYGTTEIAHPHGRVGCLIDGCDGEHRSLGYCGTHYHRLRVYGDPNISRPHQNPPVRYGPDCHSWKGDEIGYWGAHGRVRSAKGPAKDYPCSHCQSQATDWAYDHTDPDPKYAVLFWSGRDRTVPYSTDPSRYIPLCKPCHVGFDKRMANA